MDEFGVLVESIGFKAHGKSAPMTKLKAKPNFSSSNNGFAQGTGVNSTSNDFSSFVVDDLDGIFRSDFNIGKPQKSHNYFDNSNDIFGGPFSTSDQSGGIDLDSVFKSSSNSSFHKNSVGSNGYGDWLGATAKGRNSFDDLSGNFGMNPTGWKGKKEEKGQGFDDLMPGFATNPSSNAAHTDTKMQASGHSSNSNSHLADDPFLVFESFASPGDASWPFAGSMKQDVGKGSVQSSIDELEDFAMGKVPNNANTNRTPGKSKDVRSTNVKPSFETLGNIKLPVGKMRVDSNKKEAKAKQEMLHRSQNIKDAVRAQRGKGVEKKGFENDNDLDAIFSSDAQRNHVTRPSSRTEDSLFDTLFHEKKEFEVASPDWSSHSTKKASSVTNNVGDFSSLFGDTSTGEFKEEEGESEERRRARLDRHMRTKARMAKALSEKNQRDLQIQSEQEERSMFAETMDYDVKRWATGKEGNLRALLSSLQQVLWPECGWQQVSLTDLITSTSVKKVYHKATLCVHPDKVQQKGATLQQKYIAEKVFDLLKEAWNKFNAEELR